MKTKTVEVRVPWGNLGVGQNLIVKEKPTAPYYDGSFYVLQGGERAIPVSNVIDT